MNTEATRLDIWLWAARFYRTRSLAKQAVETGKVEVAAIGDQRGPATRARTMYVESEASRVARENRLAALRAARAGYQPPQGKPDKRARRLIRALGDIDAT